MQQIVIHQFTFDFRCANHKSIAIGTMPIHSGSEHLVVLLLGTVGKGFIFVVGVSVAVKVVRSALSTVVVAFVYGSGFVDFALRCEVRLGSRCSDDESEEDEKLGEYSMLAAELVMHIRFM